MDSKMLPFLISALVFVFSEASVIKMTQELDTTAAPKVQVVFYMESLCPGCLDCLQNHMTPAYHHIADIMNLTVLPYGNAEEHKSGKKYVFRCQHGYQECQGNLVETCVLHYYSNLTNNLDFMVCLEKDMQAHEQPVWTDSLKNCAKPFGIDEGKITKCVNGDEGMELEHAVASQTGDHDYVPWIIVNGKHQKDWEFSITRAICDAYTGPKPDYCKKTDHQSVSSEACPVQF